MIEFPRKPHSSKFKMRIEEIKSIFRFNILNYFNIIGVSLFLPNTGSGVISQIFSIITTFSVYLILLIFFTKK